MDLTGWFSRNLPFSVLSVPIQPQRLADPFRERYSAQIYFVFPQIDTAKSRINTSSAVANRNAENSIEQPNQSGFTFWLQKQRPHGILYYSRLNDEINLALYNVALPNIRVSTTRPLLQYRTEVAGLICEFKLAIV